MLETLLLALAVPAAWLLGRRAGRRDVRGETPYRWECLACGSSASSDSLLALDALASRHRCGA